MRFPLCILAIAFYLFQACTDKKKHFTRYNTKIYKEVFYCKVSKWDSATGLSSLSENFDKAFSLLPIKTSSYQSEIRIYYQGAFCERFFRETIYKDSVDIQLLDCRSDRRNDSLFMKTGALIQAKGKLDKQLSLDLDSLPANKIWQDKQDDVLDGINTYFIEVKRGSEIKRILIDNPLEKETAGTDGRHIYNLLKTIQQQYSFRFFDKWYEIDSLAFRNP